MRKVLAVLGVIAVCGIASQVSGQGNVIISDQRIDRSAPAPLVVMLHGADRSARKFRAATGFDRAARRRGLMVAYPDLADPGADLAKSAALLAGLIDQMRRDPRVQAAPAVVIGHGVGGVLALALACAYPDRMAGLGVVGANAMARAECSTGPAKPAIFLHGTADRVFPHNGRASDAATGADALRPATETIAIWARRNNCTQDVRITRRDRNAADRTQVVFRDHTRCRAALSQVLILGGGHGWPTGRGARDPSGGRISAEINGSEVLLEFLAPLVGR